MTAFATKNHMLTPEHLVYDTKRVTQAGISPDGSRIAYIVESVDQKTGKHSSHLWLADIDGGRQRRLSHRSVPHSSPIWSPSGDTIAYVADRIEGNGYAIFALPLAGGEPREIVAHRQVPSQLAWSPDGTSIAYILTVDPENPSEEERDPEAAAPIRVVTRPDYKQDGRGFVNDVRQSLFVVNVESGEHRQLTTVANDHSAPRWHIDGTTIGVQRSTFHGLYQQLILVNAVSGDETIIGEPGETIRAWTWTPDGSSLVLIHAPHYAFNASIVVRELESGSERIVARDLDWTPAVLVGWTDEGRLLIAGASAGEVQLGALDISADHPTPQCIGSPGGHPAGELRGSRQLAVISDVPEHVGELDVYDLISRTSTEITSLNTSLDLPEIEKRQVENEGLTIDYWITKPVDFSPERRYPVVLQIHGGPHGAHGPGFNATAQLLAAAGYVVVLPNPRGSGGYSDAFTSAVVGDWGGGDWRDLLAALDDALTLPYTDADRVGVYGYSYGGYMSAWAIGQTDRFKAAVIGAPITDLIANYGTADIGHHGGEFQWGGPVRERWDHLLARSPITHAHKATTPTLLLHPEEDQRCPISGSEQLFISLLHAGVETEFVRYPGQSHGMMGSGPAEYRLDFYERLIAWFDRFVR